MTDKLPYGEDGYTIIARVIRQEGHCVAGHQVGDTVVFEGQTIQGQVCIHALYSFLPKVFALRYGAELSLGGRPGRGDPCLSRRLQPCSL